MPLDAILEAQQSWASRRWPDHSGRRAPTLRENLILPMSPEIRRQFRRGSGNELGLRDKPGKMQSLRSSSALGYNFFAPWVGKNLAPLARVIGVPLGDATIQFERQFPHGLASTPPNIDVVLDNEQARPLGVECKFTEPYGHKKPHAALDSKYFSGGRERWTEVGLPRCQELAVAIGKTTQFARLGAAQLLKHILGLTHSTGLPARLVCLWFDSGCSEAAEHRAELARFKADIDKSVVFTAVTYQDAFRLLRAEPEPVVGYFNYMASRYFAA